MYKALYEINLAQAKHVIDFVFSRVSQNCETRLLASCLYISYHLDALIIIYS